MSVCDWVEEAENRYTGSGNWQTSCGNMFMLFEGDPVDNGMTYCPYCGKELKQIPFKLEEEYEEKEE